MNCDATCKMPLNSKLMQQSEDFCSCNDFNTPKAKRNSRKSKKSKCGKLDCNEDFTPSGMEPEKTAGPLTDEMKCCTKYAPCGCWDTCEKSDHCKNCFEGYQGCSNRAPFGPYGPWTTYGPSQFKIIRSKYINQIYSLKKCKRDGLNCGIDKPMGSMRPWPLSGSCRYAGRPYGPCRPFGAYKSRGPFGIWSVVKDPADYGRPLTPAQPCWKQSKPGYRPCTPCHRPLFRPCKDECITNAKCDYEHMDKIQGECEENECDQF